MTKRKITERNEHTKHQRQESLCDQAINYNIVDPDSVAYCNTDVPGELERLLAYYHNVFRSNPKDFPPKEWTTKKILKDFRENFTSSFIKKTLQDQQPFWGTLLRLTHALHEGSIEHIQAPSNVFDNNVYILTECYKIVLGNNQNNANKEQALIKLFEVYDSHQGKKLDADDVVTGLIIASRYNSIPLAALVMQHADENVTLVDHPIFLPTSVTPSILLKCCKHFRHLYPVTLTDLEEMIQNYDPDWAKDSPNIYSKIKEVITAPPAHKVTVSK